MRLDGAMTEEQQQQSIVLVGEDGQQVVLPDTPGDERSPAEMVEQPAKVMRIGLAQFHAIKYGVNLATQDV